MSSPTSPESGSEPSPAPSPNNDPPGPYHVQVGKNKSAYQTRWTLTNFAQACFYYRSLNTHSGYKKRLLDGNGKTLARYLA